MRHIASRFVFAAAILVILVTPALMADEVVYSPELALLQQRLAGSGAAGIQLSAAEIVTKADGVERATTLIANNRTHLINSQFVENDPRRGGGSNITYVVDQSDGSALSWASVAPPSVVLLSNGITEPIIDRSMALWTSGPRCNGPSSIKLVDSGGNIDLVDDLVLGGSVGSPTADITHAGWLPALFFSTRSQRMEPISSSA